MYMCGEEEALLFMLKLFDSSPTSAKSLKNLPTSQITSIKVEETSQNFINKPELLGFSTAMLISENTTFDKP